MSMGRDQDNPYLPPRQPGYGDGPYDQQEIVEGLRTEGHEAAFKKVKEWLEPRLNPDKPANREFVGNITIELYLRSKDDERIIDEFPVDISGGEPANADDLADAIVKAACAKAMMFRGVTNYLICVKESPSQICVFSIKVPIRPHSTEDNLERVDELPNSAGIIAMLMNFAGSSNREMHSMVREARDEVRLDKQEMRQDRHLLGAQQIQLIRLFEELTSKKHERDLSYREFEEQQQNKKRGLEMLEMVAMAVGGQMLPPHIRGPIQAMMAAKAAGGGPGGPPMQPGAMPDFSALGGVPGFPGMPVPEPGAPAPPGFPAPSPGAPAGSPPGFAGPPQAPDITPDLQKIVAHLEGNPAAAIQFAATLPPDVYAALTRIQKHAHDTSAQAAPAHPPPPPGYGGPR